MKYDRSHAKEYAQEHLRGVWAATPTPFRSERELDEEGWRRNLRHWMLELEISGLFISGKQGEFYSMSVSERKRLCEIAVEAAREHRSPGGIAVSCSDQNFQTVLELAEHAQQIGSDYIVVHTPTLHFGERVESTVQEYYRYLAERIDIGIVMWSHPDSGYVLSPAVCAQIAAECPNVVAIKYSVPRAMYKELTSMARNTLIVSTASEAEWLDNIIELGWRLYLCSVPPLLYQTRADRRIHEYTSLAFAGRYDEARRVRNSLEPVRRALVQTRPPGTPHAQQKYWQELLGQVGGPVRRPLLALTDAQRDAIRAAFDSCGLAPTALK